MIFTRRRVQNALFCPLGVASYRGRRAGIHELGFNPHPWKEPAGGLAVELKLHVVLAAAPTGLELDHGDRGWRRLDEAVDRAPPYGVAQPHGKRHLVPSIP